MKPIPDTKDSLVLRTDFASDAAWESLCREIEQPVSEFRAHVRFISDREYDSAPPEDVVTLASLNSDRFFIFMVDAVTLSDPEHPVLVLDLRENRGSSFRVIPSEMWAVENNLALANMDFSDFKQNARNGVFRGFGK